MSITCSEEAGMAAVATTAVASLVGAFVGGDSCSAVSSMLLGRPMLKDGRRGVVRASSTLKSRPRPPPTGDVAHGLAVPAGVGRTNVGTAGRVSGDAGPGALGWRTCLCAALLEEVLWLDVTTSVPLAGTTAVARFRSRCVKRCVSARPVKRRSNSPIGVAHLRAVGFT